MPTIADNEEASPESPTLVLPNSDAGGSASAASALVGQQLVGQPAVGQPAVGQSADGQSAGAAGSKAIGAEDTVAEGGATDWSLLLGRAIVAYLVIWLGIALAGAGFGTCIFPIIGTMVGFVLAAMAGAVTSLLGVLLHVALRGRAPLRLAASFAGAAAGVAAWGPMDSSEGGPLPPLHVLPMVTALIGGLGAVWASRWLLKTMRMTRIAAPLARGQFSLADMMLLTAWLAVALTTTRLFVPLDSPGSHLMVFSWAAVIAAAMALIEGLRLAKRRVFRRADPIALPTEAPLASETRLAPDTQMATE